jgi:hypothetical protein
LPTFAISGRIRLLFIGWHSSIAGENKLPAGKAPKAVAKPGFAMAFFLSRRMQFK